MTFFEVISPIYCRALVGAGQLGMAITRRVGFNHKIIIGDKNFDNAIAIADTLEGVDLIL